MCYNAGSGFPYRTLLYLRNLASPSGGNIVAEMGQLSYFEFSRIHIQISPPIPDILTEDFRGLSQYLQANAKMVA
jgi:hypothetical protein